MRFPWPLTLAAAAAAAAPGTYTNPVVLADAPDPGATFDPATSTFWSATTTGSAPCFALRSSPDLASWADAGFAFAADALPAWVDAAAPSCWAPELHFACGAWRMYFVARHNASGLLAVGAATSAGGPGGPWVDAGAPVVLDAGAGAQGQIDPTYALDEAGAPTLVWKTDGNADGRPTPIRAARLDAGNCSTLAEGPAAWRATQLITNDLPGEGTIVEAPWVVSRNGTFFLFYSANDYGVNYAVGVARAPALRGPYVKHGAPILKTAPDAAFPAPGHCSVLAARDGATAIVYHAHLPTGGPQRHIMLDALQWVPDGAGGEWPAMASGQPYPGVGVQRVP
jgi:beta-xylosidase